MRHGAAASRRRERTHHWTGHRRAWRSFGVSLGRKTEDRWIGRPAPADSLTPLKRWCQSEQPCACRTRDCPLMIGSRMPQQFEAPQRRLSRARRGCTAMSAICAARCPAPVRGSAAAESKWTAPPTPRTTHWEICFRATGADLLQCPSATNWLAASCWAPCLPDASTWISPACSEHPAIKADSPSSSGCLCRKDSKSCIKLVTFSSSL